MASTNGKRRAGARSGAGAKTGRGTRAWTGAARAASPDARPSLYAEVTARIVAELEAGRFPWVQPWDKVAAQPGLPRNAVSGRHYSGINVLILWGEAIAKGWSGQGWLTFRQALASGGAVRKGERGTCVCYADRFVPGRKDGDDDCGREHSGDGGGEAARSVAFLKRFTVFNTDQIEWQDGRIPRFAADCPPLARREIVPVGEALIAASGADFRIGGDRAFYAPAADYVQVPPRSAFRHQIDWYRTATHELGHWTGHASRLARDQSGAFGSNAYAREELVAELSAAFVCAHLGIVPSVRHADYLGSWLDVLRADTRAIFRAASLAAKSADYLLARLGPDAAAAAMAAPVRELAA